MSDNIKILAMRENRVELGIVGVIGYWDDNDPVDADYFIDSLNWAAQSGAEVLVRIDSIGGSYIQGLRIADAIKAYPHALTTRIDDRAYSIASLIAMAGQRREIVTTASGMMIHEVWAQDVSGTADQLQEVVDMLREIRGIFAEDYQRIAGVDVTALLDGTDHFFTPEECITAGYADEIVSNLDVLHASSNPAPRAKLPIDKIAACLRACIDQHKTTFTQPVQPQAAPAVNLPAAAAASIVSKGQTMPEITPTPAAPQDVAAIQAKAVADYQARAKALTDTGKAYAKFGGEALAMQAVSEGWTEDQLNAKLLAAASSGPAHAAYGQGARTEDNIDAKTYGFKSLGEFAHHVRNASLGNGRLDQRLKAAASTYGNEGSGADGGFAVPPQFASGIASVALEEESLLSYADDTPVTGNSMSFPNDETTPWGSTGITATWEGEGDTKSQKKPSIKLDHLRLKKLSVLVGATDELLADSAAMGSYLSKKMSEAVRWKSNDAIINGNGAGMPLGILNGGSVVSIAKESGQAADSIVAANLSKMLSRVLKGGGPLVWLINPDAMPQIHLLTLGNMPIWTPPQEGFKGAPNGFLLGRPIIETDACDTVGDVGDIILANMGGYRAITKAGGEEFSESMHLWFDQDVTAFKLNFRMDGQPALSAAITPPNSTATRSHFAALAARA